MIDITKIDYPVLDQWEISSVLFYPRPEWEFMPSGNSFETIMIPVEDSISVGARFYSAKNSSHTILFFHGNGEIVADYDDIAPIFMDLGINFLPVDYRGYGCSSGFPNVTNMMRDSHLVLDYVRQWLSAKDIKTPIIVMGRSLGSAPALELAFHYKDEIGGLIIESGFAHIEPLLQLLGINMAILGITEEQGPNNIRKIKGFDKPTLIIHAEYDHIIPFREGQVLFEACPSPVKRFLNVPRADHNDILSRGLPAYMEAIKWLSCEIAKQ